MRIRELMEAPIPDDWDHSVYTGRTTFKQMLEYAKQRADQLGRGSSRVAFKIKYQGRDTALKIAINNRGIVQNREEANFLEDSYYSRSSIVVPMIDYDVKSGNRVNWIHTEYAKRITKSQLNRFFGHDIGEILHFLEYQKTGRSPFRIELPEHVFENEYYAELEDLIMNSQIEIGDLMRQANWGIYKGGPVIIDLGFQGEAVDLYR